MMRSTLIHTCAGDSQEQSMAATVLKANSACISQAHLSLQDRSKKEHTLNARSSRSALMDHTPRRLASGANTPRASAAAAAVGLARKACNDSTCSATASSMTGNKTAILVMHRCHNNLQCIFHQHGQYVARIGSMHPWNGMHTPASCRQARSGQQVHPAWQAACPGTRHAARC